MAPRSGPFSIAGSHRRDAAFQNPFGRPQEFPQRFGPDRPSIAAFQNQLILEAPTPAGMACANAHARTRRCQMSLFGRCVATLCAGFVALAGPAAQRAVADTLGAWT